ncbi:MAG: hypothetical protein GY811_20670 [Myxococcales bacterium]|nr:hypothetical protein [Myxococcales bacterium]
MLKSFRLKPLILPGLATCIAIGVVAPVTAHAQHDVRLFLAESGVEFIEESVPAAIPSVFELPTISKSFTCMDFEQSNTVVNMGIDDLDIAMPSQDRITINLDFNINASGRLYADDLYACFGSATCNDSMNLDRGSASLDFDLAIVAGEPRVTARSVDFNVESDDFDLTLDDCGFTGMALTAAIDFTEGWILSYVEDQIITIAQDNLAPMLEETLSGLAMESNFIHASVEDLYFPNDGISVTIDSGFPRGSGPAACVADYDQPSPARASGAPVPDIQTGNNDVSMALNFGLLNEAMYTVWRQGILCLTDEHIAALGVELDLRMAGALLPGFPAGTEFGLEIKFTDYPRVRGAGIDASSLTLDIEGLVVKLHGDRPDETRNTLTAELSIEVTAKLGVNPGSNAIYAQLVDAEITHMRLEDERDATGAGFDVARIQQMVHQAILPHLLSEMGPVPLTGPVFAVSDYAIMLRSIATNKAYASAGVDLFQLPKNDSNAPDTAITDAPANGNAHDAIVRVIGSDAELPSELLQYQVTVNGEAHEPSFIRDIKIGAPGFTDTYEVSVAAIDMAGNIDPSPATTTMLVDGIVPFVAVEGARNRNADKGPTNVAWTMSDDITASQSLEVRIEIYELADPTDALSAKLIESRELLRGATNATVNLEKEGGIYRVEVHVVDKAGNDSRSSLLLTSASVGGCSTGGTSGSSSAALLLLALGLVWRRRSPR